MAELFVGFAMNSIYFIGILGALLSVPSCLYFCFLIIKDLRYEFSIFMHNDIPENISELTDELRKRMLEYNK